MFTFENNLGKTPAFYTVFRLYFQCEQHYSKLANCFSTAAII